MTMVFKLIIMIDNGVIRMTKIEIKIKIMNIVMRK